MRILLSFLQDQVDHPHPIPAYRFWSYYIKQGIEEAGMRWTEVPGLDWAAGLVPYEDTPELAAWKTAAWEKTVAHVEQHKNNIDIFLTYLYPKQIDENAIRQIQKLGIPCVNFYCDNVREFKKVPAAFKVFDLLWVPEYEALKMYRDEAISHVHLPMPMWVAPEFRTVPVIENNNYAFVGSRDQLREQLLSAVIKGGLALEIRGAGWKTDEVLPTSFEKKGNKLFNQLNFIKKHGVANWIGKTLQKGYSSTHDIPSSNIFDRPDFTTYMNITRESLVTLGINRVPSFNMPWKKPVLYSRLRDLEVPMLGGCYLTEYSPGLSHLYEIGKDIEVYSTAEELIEKAKLLSADPTLRKALRANGQQKALELHSIPNSLKKIKTLLGS